MILSHIAKAKQWLSGKCKTLLKAALCSFASFKCSSQNHFYDSSACNGENGTPAADTVHPAGLLSECQVCQGEMGAGEMGRQPQFSSPIAGQPSQWKSCRSLCYKSMNREKMILKTSF